MDLSLASIPVTEENEDENDFPFGPGDKLAVMVQDTAIRPGLIDHAVPVLVNSIPVQVWHREDLQLYCAKCASIGAVSYGRQPDLCIESLKRSVCFVYKEYVKKSDSMLYPEMKRKKYQLMPYFEDMSL